MRELHLFAGAGGGILGGMLLGHTCVCAVEIEPYRRKVLLQRQRDGILPKFPIWDDVCTFDGRPWRGKADIVCGGFPCQDISIAGRGVGIKGDRSGLWGEMVRIISEVRPRFVFVENSPELVNRGLGTVLGNLSGLGFHSRYGVMGGYTAGMCADGKRLWIFAHASNQKRWYAPKVSMEIAGARKSSRRQFERAISAAARVDEHAELMRDPERLAVSMDRIAAIGDGQFPSLVRLAWNTLSEGLI